MATDEVNLRSGGSVPACVDAMSAEPDSSGAALARRIVLAWNGSRRGAGNQDPARLLHILESVSDFVGIVGPDNKLMYINPAGRALLGVDDAEAVSGIRFPDLHPPATAKTLENVALPAAVRDGIWTGESAVRTRAGREIAVSQVLIARRAPDGRLDSVAIVMRDIRRRKRQEAALRQSEERFRLLIETMNEGYAVTDRHGVLVFVNDRFARMLGCSPSDVIGHALLDFVEPTQRDPIAKRFEMCSESDRLECEALLVRAQGGTVSARLGLRRIAAAEAGSAGVCVVVTDRSAEAQLEKALRDSQQDLRCLSCQVLTAEETERKRIAADLHDGLGQSLSTLKFGVERALCTLDANAVDDTRRTLETLLPKVREALDEVRRMAMNLRPSTLDDLGIVATLSWFVREFQTIYGAITVDTDLRIVEADVPDALKVTIFRIVQEALSNVAKHARAKCVKLSVEKTGGLLMLVVADDGVGFDPVEVASREHCDRRHGHAGLRDRIEFSGGTLAIGTAPGKGVCLRMSWPCAVTGAGGVGVQADSCPGSTLARVRGAEAG